MANSSTPKRIMVLTLIGGVYGCSLFKVWLEAL